MKFKDLDLGMVVALEVREDKACKGCFITSIISDTIQYTRASSKYLDKDKKFSYRRSFSIRGWTPVYYLNQKPKENRETRNIYPDLNCYIMPSWMHLNFTVYNKIKRKLNEKY